MVYICTFFGPDYQASIRIIKILSGIEDSTHYFLSVGRAVSNKNAVALQLWEQSNNCCILEKSQYTGCSVNFKSTIVSYKVHKKVTNGESEWQIIPNTQEAIINEDTFNRGQEL